MAGKIPDAYLHQSHNHWQIAVKLIFTGQMEPTSLAATGQNLLWMWKKNNELVEVFSKLLLLPFALVSQLSQL